MYAGIYHLQLGMYTLLDFTKRMEMTPTTTALFAVALPPCMLRDRWQEEKRIEYGGVSKFGSIYYAELAYMKRTEEGLRRGERGQKTRGETLY